MLHMVKVVLFPWVLVRLILSATPTVLTIAWLPMRRWENILISLVVVSLVGLTSFSLYSPTLSSSQPVLETLTGLLQPSQTQLEKQLIIHQELYRLQPTDRDVLINLALLYRALNQVELADEYWAKAQKVDPNYGLFN